MNRQSFFTFQALVFGLVAAALTTVYITQPVLPVLQQEFGVSPSQASYTVSAVILGIALANLPFGMLADRFPVQRLILVGGAVVAACGFFCAATSSLSLLVGARFVQGLFVPALTTCLAAYLSTNLPLERLNVAMGSYVSATVAGGLGGRLLGGFIHPPLHWRYAFITASLLVVAATLAAAIATGKEDGMQSFNQSIYSLIKSGLINEKEGMRYASNPESLRMNLQGIFLDEGSRILST